MKKTLLALACGLATTLSVGCAYIPGGTDLKQVSDAVGFKNITTGDGTFENYTATGHYTGTEVGIAVGLPFFLKLIELYPMGATNEALLQSVAESAKTDGADAMINVTPHTEMYTGIPFFFVGVYVDGAMGTGITTK